MFIPVRIPQNQSFGPIFPLKLNSNLSSDILVSTRYKECLEWLNSAIQLENKPIQPFKWDFEGRWLEIFYFLFGLAVMKDQRSDAVVIQFE